MTRFYHNSKLYYRIISVLFHNSPIFFASALLLLVIAITSCEEKPTIIGSGLLPGTDFVNTRSTDTIKVAAYNRYTDSILTNMRTYSYLGRIYDPYFGDTRTDFVSQLRLLKRWPKDEAYSVDSAKLFFSIVGAKGKLDTTTIHQIQLFEITEVLNSSVKYYSNRDPNALGEIGTFSLPPIPKDTTQSFQILLPEEFGRHLLRDTSKLNQDNIANDFRTFFRGIYFTMVETTDPILVALEFTSSDFFIRVYYHNSNASGLFYDFIINTNSVRYNRYIHDYASAEPLKKITHINDGVKDSMIYLQAFNGVFPQLRMPGLTNIKNTVSRVSVNKARLTFTVFLDSVNYNTTNVPPQILMKYTKADTVKYIVPDYQVSPSFYDGTFNATTKTYSFNLASFVQEYFEGRITDPVVEMYYPEGEYKNVILKANNSRFPVKFEFTYTRF